MKYIVQFGMTSNYGGIEAFIMNIYRRVVKRNIQFIFWVYGDNKIAYEDEIISLGGIIYRQKFISRIHSPIKHYKELYCFIKNNKNIKGIHLNKADLFNIDLLIVGKILHVPIRILHAHSKVSPHAFSITSRVNQFLVPLVSNYRYACSNDAGYSMFKNIDFQVMKDGIDISKFLYDDTQRFRIRNKYNIPQNVFVLGVIGRFSAEKNIGFVLDIACELNKMNLNTYVMLVGDGGEREYLENKAKKLNIDNKVKFCGISLDVWNIYSAFDLFLLPSKEEGFGMVLLEAQANGLKCIASLNRVPFETNVSGLVTYLPLEKGAFYWAEYIKKMSDFERKDRRDIIRKNGYDIDLVSEKIISVYEGE